MKPLRFLLAAAGLVHAWLAVRFWSAVARVRLRCHGAVVGRGLEVRGPLRLHVHRTASIRIGDHCRIRSGFAGNPVGGSSRMAFWVGPGARLDLGDRVGLSNSTIVCQRSVRVEDDVFLGGDCKVYDTDFHSLLAAVRACPGNPGARTAPVVIRRAAFVGGHSIVLKGVTIGEEAVIGAGSVLRTDVPPHEVWAGNPAGYVRGLRAVRTRAPEPWNVSAGAAG